MKSKEVDIRKLKNFAKQYLGRYPLIYGLILEDRDKIPSEEFILKVKVWLQLLDKEISTT